MMGTLPLAPHPSAHGFENSQALNSPGLKRNSLFVDVKKRQEEEKNQSCNLSLRDLFTQNSFFLHLNLKLSPCLIEQKCWIEMDWFETFFNRKIAELLKS